MNVHASNHPSLRWDITKKVKRVRLTDNRLDRLLPFFVHGYLSTGMLHALLEPQKTHGYTCEELRLLKLPPNSYIEQNSAHLRRRAEALRGELIYRITDHGVEALLRHGRITLGDAELWLKLRAQDKESNYWHDVATGHVIASIALATRELGLTFVSIYELMRNAPQRSNHSGSPLGIPYQKMHFIPDAIFGFSDGDTLSCFALETDMGSEQLAYSAVKRSTIAGKYKAYRHMWAHKIHKELFGLPHLKLLIATTSILRTANIMTLLFELAKEDTQASGTDPVYAACSTEKIPQRSTRMC